MRSCLLIALVVCLFPAAVLADTLKRVRVDADEAPALAIQLERAGFDVLEGSVTDWSLELIVSTHDLQRLEDQGYAPVILAVGRPFKDIQAEQQAPDSPPTGYPDLASIIAQMNTAATNYPSLCRMVDITATYGSLPTYEGRHMYAVKISDNVMQDEDEPALLIVGNYHARELIAPVIGLYAMNQFLSQYGTNPDITAAVNNYEIWIAPTWNPDGYNCVFTTDDMWRKNRRVFPTGIGVDENRNGPFGWDSSCAGDDDPSSETYRGPSAGSEAEVQNMVAWSRDRHFSKIIDYHCYGRETLWAYDCLTHPFSTWLQQEAAALSTASGYGGAVRVPSSDGEHYHWQIAQMGAFANLIETGTDFEPPYSAAQSEAVMVWPGIMWMIQHVVPLWGYVTDSVTGQPVSATITYPNVAFTNGESNSTNPRTGRYHVFFPAGTYDLALSAPGYDPLTVTGVTITTGNSTRRDIQMSPPPNIVFPNGGETLYAGVPTAVTWTGSPTLRFQVQNTSNYGQISTITDSFERTTLGSDYTTGGAAAWYTTPTYPLMGSRSARAGAITHNQSSWMTRTASSGNLSFWYHVSSESGGDFFNFYIDGTRMVHVSGENGWSQYTSTLAAGTHELKWEYAKNGSTTAGSDSVWIDYLQIVANATAWTDIVALSDVGATSAPWTPSVLSTTCKVRIRSYYPTGAYYGAWGESDAMFTVATAPVGCAGDANCDHGVNWRDIDYFVAAMSGQTAWQNMFLPGTPSCPYDNNDVNDDGTVNWRDIDPFVARMGAVCP